MGTNEIRILVPGANGQLGSEIRKLQNAFPSFNFRFSDVGDEFDITRVGQFSADFKSHNFKYVINCAAYTAVDKAESEPELAFKVNGEAVGNLAGLCRENNVRLIHTSTDYVFDGENNTPYTEDFPTNPASLYGKSKQDGEVRLAQSGCEFINIRTSWLYSQFGNNFVKTMMKYGRERGLLRVVNDQLGSPTYAHDLAMTILTIIKKSEESGVFKTGIYHYSNEGVCTWYDFAKEIISYSNIQCKVEPITTVEFPTVAIRPKYSVFSKEKIKNTFNLSIPEWKPSLHNCLDILLSE